MRKVSFLIAVLAVAAFSWVTVSQLHADAKIAKKTGAKCTVCHTKMGKPDLNDKGKCYKEKGSLDGC